MGVENGVIKGHQASHDFLGAAKLQSLQGGDNPRYVRQCCDLQYYVKQRLPVAPLPVMTMHWQVF